MNSLYEIADFDDCIDIAAQSDNSFREMCLEAEMNEQLGSMFDDEVSAELDAPITDNFYDCCDSPNQLDDEIDEDIELDEDMSDEDGELIDMLI